MNRYFKFGLPIAAILGALAWLGFGLTEEPVRYFKTIPEVKQMGDQAQVKNLRVSGYVKEDSIRREGSNTVFLLAENQWKQDVGDSLKVVYSSHVPLPDTFREHAQALADGKLGADGAFHADNIQASVR
jgi:cytochrome c-type biogenesis protein CcmE